MFITEFVSAIDLYPFNPVKVMPFIKYLWPIRKATTEGIIPITAAAIRRFQLVPYIP